MFFRDLTFFEPKHSRGSLVTSRNNPQLAPTLLGQHFGELLATFAEVVAYKIVCLKTVAHNAMTYRYQPVLQISLRAM